MISQDQVDPATNTWHATFYAYDGHGNVRFLTNESGAVTDTYDAFGTLITATGSTNNRYLYSGEQFDPNLGLYYLRARLMNPLTGRFWSQDDYEGRRTGPASLHKYLYGGADPTNHIDPTGHFFIVSNLIYGQKVHQEIGLHFAGSSIDPIVDGRIDQILDLPPSFLLSSRPDLVDRATGEVYEIKPAGSFVQGRIQLGLYLTGLNALDPRKRQWIAGDSYSPPHVIPLSCAGAPHGRARSRAEKFDILHQRQIGNTATLEEGTAPTKKPVISAPNSQHDAGVMHKAIGEAVDRVFLRKRDSKVASRNIWRGECIANFIEATERHLRIGMQKPQHAAAGRSRSHVQLLRSPTIA